MLGHCILVGGKQGNRGKTQALVDGNGPLHHVTPALAMTGMGDRRRLGRARNSSMILRTGHCPFWFNFRNLWFLGNGSSRSPEAAKTQV